MLNVLVGEEERFQTVFEGQVRKRLLSVRLIESEFQMAGPAYENVLVPYMASLTRGKSR